MSARAFARCAFCALLLFALAACGKAPSATAGSNTSDSSRDLPESGAPAAVTDPPGKDLFVDRAADSGLDFVHINGMSGELYFIEMVGPGAGVVDYDADGDLDIYLPQGHALRSGSPETAESPALKDRLYRNDLEPSTEGPSRARFVDVTEESGIEALGYGLGVAVGDYDNDGWPDLYVLNWGANQLWRNRGDGSFEDVTAVTGTGDPGWSSSASFADFDGDGWLDLFVVNYVDYRFDNHRSCLAPSSAIDYCGPLSYPPQADHLYRNLGDGRFEEISLADGEPPRAAGLGVASADFDGDGRIDFYVANDQFENQLWRQRGDGRFEDIALAAGVAVNLEGAREASMGVDAADFDGDGDEDLFLTHLKRETNTLYRNDGEGSFTDATLGSALGAASWPYTAFGTVWLDYDGDGWLDLFVANGEVTRIAEQLEAGEPHPLRLPNQLFRNLEGKSFEEVSAASGEAFNLSEVSRGAVAVDIDDDGDPDLLVTNNHGPVRLLINRSPARTWVGARLLVGSPPRDALGTRAVLELSSGRELWRRARGDASYGSANDPRVLFAIPPGESARRLRIFWPDGAVESWAEPETGRYLEFRQGEGTAEERAP